MTKDEAEKKWCPFARIANRDHPLSQGLTSANRYKGGGILTGAECITDQCMMWVDRTDPEKPNIPMGHCKLP